MNDKVLGLVLKQSEYRENDALLVILTQEYGKLTLVARGVKKMTSKSSIACMPYVISEFCIDYVSDKTMFTIRNASLKVSNRHIQEDLEKMNIASVLCELVDKSLPLGCEDEMNASLYELLSFCLDKLNNEKEHPLVLLLFLAQMCNFLGVPPLVDECVLCGNTKIHRISIEDGGFVCADCMKECENINNFQMDLKRFRLINKAQLEHYELLKKYGPWLFDDCQVMVEFLRIHSGLDSASWQFLRKMVEE